MTNRDAVPQAAWCSQQAAVIILQGHMTRCVRAGRSVSKQRRRGFSLIEIVGAIFVNAVVIISSTAAISHHLGLLRTNEGYLRARLAAIREMERIKNLTWTQLTSAPYTVGSGVSFTAAFTTPADPLYPVHADPALVTLLPNVQAVTYVCGYHSQEASHTSDMRQIIVAVRVDATAPSLPTGSGICPTTGGGTLPAPHPKIIQLTTLIGPNSPLYP